MGIQVKVTGDPRRPQEAVDYELPKAQADDDAIHDLIFIAAMLLGVTGLLLKMKAAAYCGLVLVFSGYANISTNQKDLKNMSMAFAFCMFGLAGAYMMPIPVVQPLPAAPNA